MATNTRKLASLLGTSGAGISDAGTIQTVAIKDAAITNVKILDAAITNVKLSDPESDTIVETSAHNISGIISTAESRMGDTFTVNGNLTINDHFVLGKLINDDNGQTLTGAGYTITGTGQLTMGAYLV